jgi:hypothetical protein
MGFEISGVLGLIVLILDVWAIFNVIQSPVSMGAKILWSLFILVLPVIGFIVWLLAGPRNAVSRA